MAITAQKLIQMAYRPVGIKVTTSDQEDNALETLNNMLNFWSIDQFMVYVITQESFALTVGKGSYTIGSGGDFDTVRPVKIVQAYLRDSTNKDTPLSIDTRRTYNNIHDKSANGRPVNFTYLLEYPLGIIYFDFLPDEALTFYMDSWKNFTTFATLATSVTLPPEFEFALKMNLAVLLAAEDDVRLEPQIYQFAVGSKKAIRANTANPIDEVNFDRSLTYINKGEYYNINTDR